MQRPAFAMWAVRRAGRAAGLRRDDSPAMPSGGCAPMQRPAFTGRAAGLRCADGSAVLDMGRAPRRTGTVLQCGVRLSPGKRMALMRRARTALQCGVRLPPGGGPRFNKPNRSAFDEQAARRAGHGSRSNAAFGFRREGRAPLRAVAALQDNFRLPPGKLCAAPDRPRGGRPGRGQVAARPACGLKPGCARSRPRRRPCSPKLTLGRILRLQSAGLSDIMCGYLPM